MAKFRKLSQNNKDAFPDVTPIVDMVFILLIFFMLTSAFSRNQQLKIDLPQASTTKEQINSQTINVLVSTNGQIAIDSKPLSDNKPETVRNAFLPFLSKTSSNIIISADAQAPYQAIVTLLDVTGKLGFNKIRLNTKRLEKKK